MDVGSSPTTGTKGAVTLASIYGIRYRERGWTDKTDLAVFLAAPEEAFKLACEFARYDADVLGKLIEVIGIDQRELIEPEEPTGRRGIDGTYKVYEAILAETAEDAEVLVEQRNNAFWNKFHALQETLKGEYGNTT